MIKLNRKEEKALLTVIILFVSIGILYRFLVFKPNNVTVIKKDKINDDMNKKEDIKNAPNIYVYITGEVKNPGVYSINYDDRLSELVNKAGGFTADADTTSINLAQKLKDEQYIHVASKKNNIDNGNSTINSSIAGGKININTATAKEIDEFLPGIGETLANNIVNYRTKNGRFKSIEDVSKVDGIGSGKRFEKIKDMITVN